MLSRAAATRSTSMSATTSCGPAPAEATTSPSGDATRLPPTPVGAPEPDPAPVNAVAGVGLTGRGDVAHRVERAGPRQQRPLVEFAGARTPRRADGDQLRAAAGQLGVERRKANVVAKCQPHPDAVDRDHDRFVPGRDGTRLGEAERVVEVDLVIVGVGLVGRAGGPTAISVFVTRPSPAGVNIPAITVMPASVAIRRTPFAQGPSTGLGDRCQRDAEPAHGRLREHDQLRAGVGGLAGVVAHQLQIRCRIGATEDLRQRDSHGRQLRSCRPGQARFGDPHRGEALFV